MPRLHPRPCRRGSVFGEGRRVPLDRERRARVRFLLSAHRRARRLTPTTELIGTALLKRLGADGQCDPAHATLAADVGCSARTVGRATVAMRDLGLLRWDQRLVRSGCAPSRLRTPTSWCRPPPCQPWCCLCHAAADRMAEKPLRIDS